LQALIFKPHLYAGYSINKLQNSVILLVFQILKVRNKRSE